MFMYSVYDSKVQSYSRPFFVRNKGEALRSFSQIANDVQSQIGMYPEDFTLFELGSFDDVTAKFVLHSTPTALGVAIEFRKMSDSVVDRNLSKAQLDIVNQAASQ